MRRNKQRKTEGPSNDVERKPKVFNTFSLKSHVSQVYQGGESVQLLWKDHITWE